MSESESPKRPGQKSAGVWILVVAAAAAVLYLVLSSVSGTQMPYVTAAELRAMPGQHVRAAGRVAVGGVESSGPGDVSIYFALIDDKGDTVRVFYSGVRPDAFKEGAQAVAEGTFDPAAGVMTADLLQAKCPSKYEVAAPSVPAASPAPAKY